MPLVPATPAATPALSSVKRELTERLRHDFVLDLHSQASQSSFIGPWRGLVLERSSPVPFLLDGVLKLRDSCVHPSYLFCKYRT